MKTAEQWARMYTSNPEDISVLSQMIQAVQREAAEDVSARPQSAGEICEQFHRTHYALVLFKQRNFPIGSEVIVSADRYNGNGIVIKDYQCPPTSIPVKIENGNIWYYPLESCQPKP
jgi:hypothetical protein